MIQSFKRNKIGEILVKEGKLTSSQHMFVMDKQATEGLRYGEICIREGLLTDEDLARTLAAQFGLEYIDLKGFRLDQAVLDTIPPDAMYRYHFIPLTLQG